MMRLTASPQPLDEIHRMLVRWQGEGLLDAEAAVRIEAAEAARVATAQPLSAGQPTTAKTGAGGIVAEALGYIGGVLVLAAAGLLVGDHWADLPLGAQIATTAGASAALIVAGCLLPARINGPTARLRAVLWTASVCLAMVTWTVIAADGLHWQSDAVMLFATVLAAAQAAVLWWRAPSILLHIATFATLATGLGAAGDWLAFPPASSAAIWLWAFAVCWVLLGLLGRVSPRLTALLLGSGLAVVAAQTTADSHWGSVFALLTAAAVTAFAVTQRSIALLAVGAYAVLTSVPTAMNQFFAGSASIALGLLLAGLVLIGSAMLILRRDAGHGRLSA